MHVCNMISTYSFVQVSVYDMKSYEYANLKVVSAKFLLVSLKETTLVYVPSYLLKCISFFSCLGIWWRHEIRISKILNFNFLKNEKGF